MTDTRWAGFSILGTSIELWTGPVIRIRTPAANSISIMLPAAVGAPVRWQARNWRRNRNRGKAHRVCRRRTCHGAGRQKTFLGLAAPPMQRIGMDIMSARDLGDGRLPR